MTREGLTMPVFLLLLFQLVSRLFPRFGWDLNNHEMVAAQQGKDTNKHSNQTFTTLNFIIFQ